MFQRSLCGFGDAEPHQILWAMPGLCSGGLFGKKFSRGVRAATAWGGFAGEGDSDHPAAWSSPTGIPPQDWGQMLRAELWFAGRWILGNP